MRVFVAGSSGQVALALTERAAKRGIELVSAGRPSLDLATGLGLPELVEAASPDVVINAAAYTTVDRAEAEEELAFAVNAEGARRLAEATNRLNIPFLHLSTDYVFDGAKPAAYLETDAPNPMGAYGRSKLLGESLVMAACPGALVLRTAWVYSPFGNNFVKTMLGLAKERDALRVVDDQIGCPTSAFDIADALLTLADRAPGTTEPGVFNLVGSGETSWCGFAREIMRQAADRGARVIPVEAILTSAYPTPAKRPANSRLDGKRLRDAFGICLPDWRESLSVVMDRLVPAGGAVDGGALE
jgi:dTDP-4-dehydrorhamnose reductase